jgi:hypothetical protein
MTMTDQTEDSKYRLDLKNAAVIREILKLPGSVPVMVSDGVGFLFADFNSYIENMKAPDDFKKNIVKKLGDREPKLLLFDSSNTMPTPKLLIKFNDLVPLLIGIDLDIMIVVTYHDGEDKNFFYDLNQAYINFCQNLANKDIN